MVELTEESEKVLDKLMFCNTHADEILKLYCSECKEVICMMCHVVQHKLHDTVTVQQALDKLLPEVGQNLESLTVKLEDISKAIETTDNERNKVEKAYEECETKFDEAVEKRIRQMRNAQKQVKEKIRKERDLQV